MILLFYYCVWLVVLLCDDWYCVGNSFGIIIRTVRDCDVDGDDIVVHSLCIDHSIDIGIVVQKNIRYYGTVTMQCAGNGGERLSAAASAA